MGRRTTMMIEGGVDACYIKLFVHKFITLAFDV